MSKPLYCALFIVLMALMACSGPEASSSPTAVAQAPTTAPITAPTAAPVEAPAPTEVPAPTTAPTEVPVMATSIPTPTPEPTPAPTATPRPTSIPVPTPETLTLTWRGVTVAPEERCSPYDSDDYSYSPSVEPRIVDELGGIYGPYTGTWFESIRETDIEHIVARSEAHDSGLCAGTRATRAEFASDLLNLTLASPRRQPAPEGRQRRCRVAPRPQRVLVRQPCGAGATGIRPHHRPRRGRRNRPGPDWMRVNGDGHAGARSCRSCYRNANPNFG